MKNIKNTLFTLLMLFCLASSITNGLQQIFNTQTQSVCEEPTNLDFEIMLCHNDKGGGISG